MARRRYSPIHVQSPDSEKPLVEHGTQAIEGLARGYELRAYFVPNKSDNIVSSGDAIFYMLDDYFGPGLKARTPLRTSLVSLTSLEVVYVFFNGSFSPSGEHPMIHLPVSTILAS